MAKKKCSKKHLSKRETATVLAALRYWQTDLAREMAEAEKENRKPIINSPAHFYDKIAPLNDEEIDKLCHSLNIS